MKEMDRKLAMRDKARAWRDTADSIYARQVFASIIQPMGDAPLRAIAAELNHLNVPKVRGADRWMPTDVTRLLARVAAMADDTTTAKWSDELLRFSKMHARHLATD